MTESDTAEESRREIEMLRDKVRELESELEGWRGLRDVSIGIGPGPDGAGEETDPTPESVRARLAGLQRERDGAEERLSVAERRLADLAGVAKHAISYPRYVSTDRLIGEARDFIKAVFGRSGSLEPSIEDLLGNLDRAAWRLSEMLRLLGRLEREEGIGRALPNHEFTNPSFYTSFYNGNDNHPHPSETQDR